MDGQVAVLIPSASTPFGQVLLEIQREIAPVVPTPSLAGHVIRKEAKHEADSDDSGDVSRRRLHKRPSWAAARGGACSRPAAGGRPGSDPRRRLVAQPAGV